ncbi:hypothetical protein PQR01_00195 [Paraburkholderia rhynchosiae]|uniref:Uncharacterized protein n=1 Tax=Paraburkholderia rhynchosiae TaxID=487049 RepID=A0ACC7N5H8_9BURK
MKMHGIERKDVQPTWKMRLHSWLDMKTMKPQFSIEVRHPEKRKWAHVYEEGAEFLKMFKTQKAAERYITNLQKATP